MSEIHEAFHQIKRAVRDNAGDAGRLKEIGEVLTEAAGKITGIAER